MRHHKRNGDYLNAQGNRVGVISVHLYRPFSAKYFLRVMPKSVKNIAVLDRTKEPGALGNHFTWTLKPSMLKIPPPGIVGGRYVFHQRHHACTNSGCF
jgi:pyruvate-ferredoxin/flavodoxin oxidoreductase